MQTSTASAACATAATPVPTAPRHARQSGLRWQRARPPQSVLGSGVVARPAVGRPALRVAAVASQDRDVARATMVTVQPGSDVIRRFYDAQNRRDLAALNLLLAPGATYANLAVAESLTGRVAVGAFYKDALASVPPEARFQLEHVTTGDAAQVAVTWALVLGGASPTLMCRGLSYYCLDADGHIESVTDAPEHAVKLSRASLSFVAPLVRNLSGPLLPALKEARESLEGGLEQLGLTSLLDPLTQLLGAAWGGGGAASSSLDGPFIAGELSEHAASRQRTPSPWTQRPQQQQTQQQQQQMQQGTAAAPSSPPPPAPQPAPAPAAPAAAAPPSTVRATAAAAPPASAAAAAASRGPTPEPPLGASGASAARASSAPVNLTGLWVLDKAASDGAAYDAALDLLQLSGLQKMTARLIEALDIIQDAAQFSVGFVTVVPFFKVSERVPFGGSAQLARRDLRAGAQTATAAATERGVTVRMSWGAPFAGGLVEEYVVQPDGSLHVTGVTSVGGASARVTQVYRRTAQTKDSFLRDSQKQHGGLGDVMKRQAEDERRQRR